MDLASGSDILLGVARAARPADAKAAAQRLAERSAVAEEAKELRGLALAASVFDSVAAGSQDAAFASAAPVRTLTAPASRVAASSSPAAPYAKFEAFVLQMFIEAMLPDDAEAVFGSGTAGNVWKSFMAEALADEAVKSGGVGIAAQLSANAAKTPTRETV